MNAKLVPVIATLAAFGGLLALAIPATAYPPSDTTMTSNATDTMSSDMGMMSMWDSSKKIGMISSIQNDETGQPAWLVSGHFMIGMQNDTASDATSNMTEFHAGFHMVMLDGSAAHTHEIYNFTMLGDGMTESANMTTMRGTSTVMLSEGPVHDVGTEISIAQDKVITISLDPAATENHFGDTPIYGLVLTPEMFHQMMNTTSASTMMDGMMSDKHNRTGTAMNEEWK